MLNLLATALCVLSPQAAPAIAGEDLASSSGISAARFERLAELLEEERILRHIPGFALAVVHGDEIVMARGFGVSDVAEGTAVTPETIFAIGSATKAFTSTALGMLQDDGLLDFDDPVMDHLPYFDLAVELSKPDADGVVTLRDLLCHRTGFSRMSALFGSPNLSRRFVLETASGAEPTATFRTKFQYNNIMFLAAGMAAAEVAGVEWEELIQTRLLTPLGMASTTLSIQEAQLDERLSMGYEWNSATEEFDQKRMVDLRVIAPAGAINSNVLDMAQWLRFQLGLGKYKGEQLLGSVALAETWIPQVSMGGDSSYALGWMIRTVAMGQVFEHGGNIDGFGAQVAFMPSEDLGFVLLTNVTATSLQQESMALVFETLLGEEQVAAEQVENLEDFEADYAANFAPFDGEFFEVYVEDDHLVLAIPGQPPYELKAPDAEGQRKFKLTDAISISFERDEAGDVVKMHMNEKGAKREFPRDGVEFEAEIPLEELKKFLGTFYQPKLKENIHVMIQNDHLAVDVPSQRIYELHMPDEEGMRYFRLTDQISVRLNEDSDGRVNSMSMYQAGQSWECMRVGEAPEAGESDLPTTAELYALQKVGGRALILKAHGTYRSVGTVRLPQAGISGTYVYEARLDPPAYSMKVDLGVFGSSEFGADAQDAWTFNRMRGYQELSGAKRDQIIHGHPTTSAGPWKQAYDSIKAVRRSQVDGAECYVVEARIGELPKTTLLVEVSTGRVLRTDTMFLEGPMRVPTQVSSEDFREVLGELLPFVLTQEIRTVGSSVLTLVELEAGVELPTDFHVYQDE